MWEITGTQATVCLTHAASVLALHQVKGHVPGFEGIGISYGLQKFLDQSRARAFPVLIFEVGIQVRSAVQPMPDGVDMACIKRRYYL